MDNGMDMDLSAGLPAGFQADLRADFQAVDSDPAREAHVDNIHHHSQRHRLPHPQLDFHDPHHDPHFDYGRVHESDHGINDRHIAFSHYQHPSSSRSDRLPFDPSVSQYFDVDDPPRSRQSASHAAANLDSVSSNAQHAFSPVNPDDFYKSYRALHLNSNSDALPMTAASPPRPSLRSNGDGGTPKHAVVSPNRMAMRSSSNPVDNRPAAPNFKPGGSHPSVRDLKKRFDQNGASGSSIPRAPASLGAAARSRRDAAANTQPRNGATSYSTLRDRTVTSNPASSASPSSSRSQRAKYVAEDQVSNNSQSFASRIGKPRVAVSGNSNASNSLTNLEPKSPPQPSTSSPTPSHSHGLLFGEVLPDQNGSLTAGYGIESIRPRRTSESSIPHTWTHQRSLSDPDVEPASPSTWYRSLNGDGTEEQTETESKEPKESKESPSKGHARSQSDVPKTTSGSPASRKQASRKQAASSNSSKLPLSVRKLNSPTPSQSSTRSSSPPAFKRPQTNGRTSRTGTATRAKTPTSRAKTPTQTSGSRKAAPRGIATPTNNARLRANIIAPPPKLSPPLRSSRPRQPVSLATTASSRMKTVERARSPNPLSRPPSRTTESTARRRKISVGPIDFEKRREDIRLAYSKSIRESQALEVRQKAADRRRKEMEAAAKAKASAAALVIAPVPSTTLTPDPSVVDPPDIPPVPDVPPVVPSQDAPHPHTDDEAEGVRETIVDVPEIPFDSSLSPVDIAAALPPDALMLLDTKPEFQLPFPSLLHTQSVDSPTLGLPGSFPPISPPATVDKRPRTAESAGSGSTQFENEPQVAPTVHTHSTGVPITIVKPPSPLPASPPRARVEYQYPFMDEPESPKFVATIQHIIQEPDVLASTLSEVSDPVIPGAFSDESCLDRDAHHEATPTTVTILPSSDDTKLVERPDDTIPFPRMEPAYDSDCQSLSDHELGPDEHHHINENYDDDAVTDTCTEETDDHNKTEDCQSESHFGDQISSHRVSVCESSDTGTMDDHDYDSYDPRISDPPRNLMVPSSSGADRRSQQTTWTDYTMDSQEISDVGRSPAIPDYEDDDPGAIGHVTIFETISLQRDTRPDSRLQEYHHHQEVRPSIDSTRSYMGHQLPGLDTGNDFSIPYLNQRVSRNLSYASAVNHDAAPIPTPVSESACNSQRTSGVFYEPSQNGSTFVGSERGSEEYIPAMATPQSMDTASLPAQDQYFAGSTPADSDPKLEAQVKNRPSGKERHRLQQRRNVIKELVDTEAVFVRDMNIVEEIYKGTAEACPKLDDQTVKLIFRNTDDIIEFHTSFLQQVREAVASVYAIPGRRPALSRQGSFMSESGHGSEIDDVKDRASAIGPVFKKNMERMKLVHEGFLRNSDQAAKKLIQIQQDPTVKVWLNECNEVAKDLTAAWDLDSLLIKPMQRITKYPNLIVTLLQHTPEDHPDRDSLVEAKDMLETAIIDINKTKKNFELVGQIVGRKRKESDVKAGFARAFGKRVDKLQASGNRPAEDADYAKLNERFGDDYLRLQVVLRDVEFYTRQVAAYVHEFLQYLSSIELVMRFQPGSYPELEAKWVQFNISIRDLEKVALEDHLSQVRKRVIEPFELVIKAYGNPSLAMKKRQKRRVDFERYEQLKKSGKNPDAKLKELVEQYEALNDTLKKELPKLSALTEKIGNICLGNFVNIQASWYSIWKDKMKVVLGEKCPDMPELKDIVAAFHRDHPYAQEQLNNIGILNPAYRGRMSQSTTRSTDDVASHKLRTRPSDAESRGRGLSDNGDQIPSLPQPDFKRHSGSFAISPSSTAGAPLPSPHNYYYRDYYAGIGVQQGAVQPTSPEVQGSTRSIAASTRPSTGRSFDSGTIPRQSSDSTFQNHIRDSNTTYSSNTTPAQEGRRFSGLFHSALPLPDGPEESARSSRASSRERGPTKDGYNVLWLAASLFEFNIATTKHEAGYPYLVYQAGEIFDVIAEKGELWLAKNQDDPGDQVGWIWSKHFAKLADS
ncbi:hypothetical protein BGZ63DRAFT_131091 [Mariannaea sp. PMI_226]|nr:hypothetical protein BGZ63DRAFT_131091 [Mariannaea sp. PMI_226]